METAKSKWWYRLIQVVYVFFAALLVLGAGMAVYDSWPELSTYDSKYKLVCFEKDVSNGRTWMSDDFSGSVLNYGATDFSNDRMVELMRLRCANPEMTREEFSQMRDSYEEGYRQSLYAATQFSPSATIYKSLVESVPKNKNYEIYIVDKEYFGSLRDVVFVFLVSIIFIPAFLLLIRSAFLYIAFGEPVLRTLLLRRG